MLYLGIDQHARQITVSLRDENGDVILARQVSTQPKKVNTFFQKLTRERLRSGESFVAVLEVCGFNDWLIRMLYDYRCEKVILIQPEERKKCKTDRRDAAAQRANTNTLFGVNYDSDELVTFSTSTGAPTTVGALGFPTVQGLAFDPNSDTLYGADPGTDQLLTINTSTGAGTLVGPLGFTAVTGLGFDPNANTLFGVDIDTDQLLTIDTSTGTATAVGPLGFGDVEGLAFDPMANVLFGVDNITDQLLTINTTTGVGSPVGALGFSQVHGLALPEPSSIVLVIVGVIGLIRISARSRG